MWTTVLLLATALNLEPNRLALIALIMIRPQPIKQLVAFLIGSFVTSGSIGALILFALHRGTWLGPAGNGAKAQIVIGILAICVALILATNLFPGLLAPSDQGEGSQPQFAKLLSRYLSRITQGSSAWFAAALGVGLVAIPSVDYIALLVLVAAAGLSMTGQLAVLLTFLTVANAILLIPIVSYLVNPIGTQKTLERLRDWVLARRRRDYAVLLGMIGLVMIIVGWRGM